MDRERNENAFRLSARVFAKRRKALCPSAVPLCFILSDALSDTAIGDIHAL